MLCVGGATLDRSYRLAAPLRAGTSNPVTGRRGFGGVARNVAENLRGLGVPSGLLSCVGDDEGGRALVAALDALGVDRRGVMRVAGAATADYAAVLTPEGELALGLADMAVFDALTPAALARHAELFAVPRVFADCNLPGDSLAALARRAFGGGYRLAVDAVSVAKAARLPERLDGIDLLLLNRDEGAALAARHGGAGAAPGDVAAALLRAGAGAVVLTLGSEGAVAATPRGLDILPAVPARPRDVTGAGDALAAAVLCGLGAGLDLPAAVALGCRAAARTVESEAAVVPQLAATPQDPRAIG